MDTSRWPQDIVVNSIGEIVTNTCPKPSKLARPAQKEQALNCPRCNSMNTKFCYYNNYSLTQPRYFCKSCRRYWTEGGSLRNIPVGGGSRKNKKSSSSSSPSSSSISKKLPDLVRPQSSKTNQGQDLSLEFPANYQEFSISSSGSQLSAMELLTGFSSRGLNSFMPDALPDPNSVYTNGFNLHELKPSLNFSLDGFGIGYGSTLQGGVPDQNNGRILFPFEDLKQVSSTTTATGIHEQNKEQAGDNSTGYWTGMLGGGSW